MDIQHLPNDLNIDTESEVQIFDYQATSSSVKNKVMLNKHVFSFLLEGTKELITQDKATIINNDAFLLIKSGNCLMTENLSEMESLMREVAASKDAVDVSVSRSRRQDRVRNGETTPPDEERSKVKAKVKMARTRGGGTESQ